MTELRLFSEAYRLSVTKLERGREMREDGWRFLLIERKENLQEPISYLIVFRIILIILEVTETF